MTLSAGAVLLTTTVFALASSRAVNPRTDDASSVPFELAKPGLDVGLVVSDMDKAKRFYGDGLGLKLLAALPVALPGGGQMLRFQSGATVVKLLTYPKTPPKVEHGVMLANGIRLMTMMVKDPDALAKSLTHHGYKAPQFGAQSPRGYRVAFIDDPDGNRIELLTWGPNAPSDIYDRFQIGLTVSDAEKMRAFYGKVLGLAERPPQPLPASIAADTNEYFFTAGETTIKFWSPKTERPTRSGAIGDAQGIRYITFVVKDVDATFKVLQARGVKVPTPPTDLGTFARIMIIADPDGNAVEFATRRTDSN
jgi:catechol 2,3-dioxygenase-like lactoylglutathione lyase family enzyme